MVESVIRHNDPDVPVEMVRATRGKAVRAAPVHDLCEQHRVHHIGDLSELEYEMTHWDPDESDWSPNRLDALVWAMTELVVSARPSPVAMLGANTQSSNSYWGGVTGAKETTTPWLSPG